jgi:hypothetical protein
MPGQAGNPGGQGILVEMSKKMEAKIYTFET